MLTLLSASLFVVAMDATVLHTAVPAIAAELAPTQVALLTVVDVYSLVAASLLIAFGTLGDRYGHRRVLHAGYLVFGFASLAATMAPNIVVLILARAALGLGGAMIMPATLAVVRHVFPNRRERQVAIGVWSSVAGAGAGVGPLLGGFLVEQYSWHMVFAVNVPLMAVVMLLGFWMVPQTRVLRARRWDVLSAVLATVGVLSLSIGIKQAGTGIPSFQTLVPLTGAVLLLTWFVVRQRKLKDALLDVRMFADVAFSVAVGTVLLVMVILVGLGLHLVQYLQLVLSLGPLEAGLQLLPLMLAVMLGGLVAVPVIHRRGSRTVAVGGIALIAVSLLLILPLDTADHPPVLALSLLGVGLGISAALTAASDILMAAVPRAQAGAAAAVEETAYELGSGLGVAIIGSVTGAVYRFTFPSIEGVPTSAVETARSSLPEAVRAASGLPAPLAHELIDTARRTFMHGLHVVVIVSACVLTLIAVLAYRLLPEERAVPKTQVPKNQQRWVTPASLYRLISRPALRTVLGWDLPRRDVRWVEQRPGSTCLEIGSGGGYYTHPLREHIGASCRLIALDPAAEGLAQLQTTGSDGAQLFRVVGDGCALHFPDESIDTVFYGYSLEEMPDPTVALAEAERVLRPGGQLVIFLWRPALTRSRRRGIFDCLESRFVSVRVTRNPQNIRLAFQKPVNRPCEPTVMAAPAD